MNYIAKPKSATFIVLLLCAIHGCKCFTFIGSFDSPEARIFIFIHRWGNWSKVTYLRSGSPGTTDLNVRVPASILLTCKLYSLSCCMLISCCNYLTGQGNKMMIYLWHSMTARLRLGIKGGWWLGWPHNLLNLNYTIFGIFICWLTN